MVQAPRRFGCAAFYMWGLLYEHCKQLAARESLDSLGLLHMKAYPEMLEHAVKRLSTTLKHEGKFKIGILGA